MSLKSFINRNVGSIKADIKTAQNTANSVQTKVTNAIKDAATKVLTDVRDIPYAVLLPFKPIMVQALDKRKIAHTSKLYDIAPKFVNHVIKNMSFESATASFSDGSNGTLYNADGESNSSGGTSASIIAMAATVIPMIVKYFKDLKAKKDKANAGEGEPLTADETLMLNQGEIIAETVNNATDQTTIASGVKDFLFSWKGGVLLVVIVGLLFLAFGGKTKKA